MNRQDIERLLNNFQIWDKANRASEMYLYDHEKISNKYLESYSFNEEFPEALESNTIRLTDEDIEDKVREYFPTSGYPKHIVEAKEFNIGIAITWAKWARDNHTTNDVNKGLLGDVLQFTRMILGSYKVLDTERSQRMYNTTLAFQAEELHKKVAEAIQKAETPKKECKHENTTIDGGGEFFPPRVVCDDCGDCV